LLREARALDPWQPAYAEEIGRLYHLRALALVHTDPLAQDYARQGLEYQREAARRRPSSPHTWANIALLKGRLPEADAEFEASVRNAAALGPWEPEVQIAVAEAGLVHWTRLSPETRTAVRANLERTLRWQDAKLFELARGTGQLGLVCALPGVARSKRAVACI